MTEQQEEENLVLFSLQKYFIINYCNYSMITILIGVHFLSICVVQFLKQNTFKTLSNFNFLNL